MGAPCPGADTLNPSRRPLPKARPAFRKARRGTAGIARWIYGTRGSAACYSIRDFLHRSDIPFQWIDLTTDEQASTEARVSGLDDARLPICVFPDGARLERATVRQITEKLGWFRSPSREDTIWRSTAPGRPGSARLSMPPRKA